MGHPLENLDDSSDCELVSCELVRVVRDVIDVLVSLSSVVTELCEVSSLCSDWEFVEPQSFLQKACTWLRKCARRVEV